MTAPATHVIAFLILHELTAIIPLAGLVAIFHYTQWIPAALNEGKWANRVDARMKKLGNYLRKKGWLDTDEKEPGKKRWFKKTREKWGHSENASRWLVEYVLRDLSQTMMSLK